MEPLTQRITDKRQSQTLEIVAFGRPDVGELVIIGDGTVEFTAPEDFVAQLFRKGGLDPDPWPPDLRAWRFVTDHFGDRD